MLENECGTYSDRLPEVLQLIWPLQERAPIDLIFDFDNYHQSGDDCWSNWLALRDRVTAFHLKDRNKANVHVPLGEGCRKVMEILEDAARRDHGRGVISMRDMW